MVLQRHDYVLVPATRVRTSAEPQDRIKHLLAERAIASRVRERLKARGALREPSASPACHEHDSPGTRTAADTLSPSRPVRSPVSEYER